MFVGQTSLGGGGDTVDDAVDRLLRDEKRAGRKPKIKRQANWKTHPLAYLIDWYYLIRAGAQSGFGHQPIAWGEVLAFRTLFDIDLDTFDVETLRRLDVTWLKHRPKPDAKGSDS